MSFEERHERMRGTLSASWEFLAAGSRGARLVEAGGVRAAIFPEEPARRIFNNALMPHRPSEPPAAVEVLEELYGGAGIDSFAAWVHESDEATGAALRARSYVHHETTHAMVMEIADASVELAADSRVAVAHPSEVFEINQLAADLLVDLPSSSLFYVLREEGRPLSAALAFHHEGDCGIYFVATLPEARRGGHSTAVMRHVLAAASRAGCTTSSLQATTTSRSLYRSLGYRDIGRNLEYRPAPRAGLP